jgi:hypothetical protein
MKIGSFISAKPLANAELMVCLSEMINSMYTAMAGTKVRRALDACTA